MNDMTRSRISRWEDRQQEIIELLPPELLVEYRQLQSLIEEVQRTVEECGNTVGSHTPMTIHKQKLIDLLTKDGPVSRLEINTRLSIPAGTVGALLDDPAFTRISRGVYGLTSPPPPPSS